MKKFLLFAGGNYYPHGGWKDYKGSFDSLMEAVTYMASLAMNGGDFDWFHVVDTETMSIVHSHPFVE